MRVIREITVAGKKVLVKELTLDELRAWLAESSRGAIDLVDELFGEQDVMIPDIPFFTDLDAVALGGLAPSEIEPLVADIREVNSRFFVIWQRRLREMGRLVATAPSNSPAALPA